MELNIIEKALNIIFPPVCGFCNEITNSYLCKDCSRYIKSKQINKIDFYDNKYFSTHLYIFKHENEIREKIIDYKFNDKSYLYRTFIQIILNNKEACKYIESFDTIIPVPIHKNRKKMRGYNQSELIARGIIKYFKNIDLRKDIMKKVVDTKAQSLLTKEERTKNISNAYKLVKCEELNDKSILLIDDVYTTGSTVNECAKILSNLNCKKIGVFSITKD